MFRFSFIESNIFPENIMPVKMLREFFLLEPAGVINTAVVIATLSVGSLILAEAALSFLGAGVPPPTPAWGIMVMEGKNDVSFGVWWPAVFPGMSIFLVVLSLNFMGDWLRDRLDPRLRQI